MVESTYFFYQVGLCALGLCKYWRFLHTARPSRHCFRKGQDSPLGASVFFTSKMVWGWKEGEWQPIASKIEWEVSLQNAEVLSPLGDPTWRLA